MRFIFHFGEIIDMETVPAHIHARHPLDSGMEMPPDGGLGRFAMALWRRWAMFVCLFLILATGGLAALLSLPPVYTASVSLILGIKGDGAAGDGGAGGSRQGGGVISRDTMQVRSQIDILKSPTAVRKVIADRRLDADPEFNPLLRDDQRGLLGMLGVT